MKISKNIIFNYFLISFLFGIFISNILASGGLSFFVLLFFVILFLNFYLYIKKYLIILFFIIIGFSGAVILSNHNLDNIGEKKELIQKYFDNSRHKLTLEIKDTYKIDKYKSKYIAKIESIDKSIIDKNILSIITLSNNFDIKKGYIIKSESYLNKIESFDSFDYQNFMLSKNIYFQSYLNSVEVVEIKKLDKLDNYLINIRSGFLEVIEKLYPEREALFLGGILLGARESLPNDLKTQFNNSGLTHFIAVSGFNITILIIFFSFLFKYFPVVLRLILITSVIIIFTLLVGDTAPVIRASIMGLIGYYIMISGRSGDNWTIVLFTASLMVLLSPLSLNYDISLHLSFLAVLGIIFTQDFFKKMFYFLPETLAIKEAFVLTMSAMSFSLPIMLFNFGQISLLSPLANIAMAWTVPFAMLFGFISILLYFVSPVLGSVFGYLDFVFLRYDMLVVKFFGTIDWALLKVDVGYYKNYLQILYFIVLSFIIMYFRGNKEKPKN